MTPIYLNPPPSSPIPFLEFKGEVPNFSYLDNTHFNVDANPHQFSWLPQDQVEKVLSHDKPNDMSQMIWPQNYMGDGSGHSSSNHKYHNKIKIVTNNDQKHSKKWKPSKVRIMQKMVTTTSKNIGEHHKLQQQQGYQSNMYKNNNNNNNNGIRVCSDCHTTTTPLWRSGPQGPKSLCNACGIRQRKARRAAMAAAELAKEEIETSQSSMSIIEAPKVKVDDDEDEREKGLVNHHGSHPLPLKKRGKMIFEEGTNHCNGYNAKSQRAFPRDEEEGAILLMALSCGLACSS